MTSIGDIVAQVVPAVRSTFEAALGTECHLVLIVIPKEGGELNGITASTISFEPEVGELLKGLIDTHVEDFKGIKNDATH